MAKAEDKAMRISWTGWLGAAALALMLLAPCRRPSALWREPVLPLLAALMPGCCLAALPGQSPETRVTVLRVDATADTMLCPVTPADIAGLLTSLRVGQGGGYADDGQLLIRFDDLPAVLARDVLQVRLGLYREWRGNAHDNADEIVKLIVPAPQPFAEGEETWQSGAARPEPNNTETRLASVARRYPRRSLEAEREEVAKLLAAARQAGEWTLWRTQPPVG